MTKKIVSLIVPALNEENNIRDTVDTICKNIPAGLDYEIVIVDGGSRDRTVEIARAMAELDSRIKLLAFGKMKGLGHAYKTGVAHARGDYIMLVPGDNEVTGDAIRAILEASGQADIIIPYFVNQEIRGTFRRSISAFFVRLLNAISGFNLHYYNGTVLYRCEVIKGYNIRSAGFVYQAEILVNLLKLGFTYREIATRIQPRTSGKTKIFKLRNMLEVLFFVAGLFLRHKVKKISKPEIIASGALPEITPGPEINYIAAFLTFDCNLRCGYCVNNYEKRIFKRGVMDGRLWVRGLNRLRLRHNLPVTLQGGEPTLHRDFYMILDGLWPDIEIDLLTNLQFDVDEFIARVDPKRLNRDARYHSIRASFHPGMMDGALTVDKTQKLQKAGFSICLSAVDHPANSEAIGQVEKLANDSGITFFRKEFLGFYDGKFYGTYKYPEAVTCKDKRSVKCRTTELLIGPNGDIHKCTRDVYLDADPVGNLMDPGFRAENKLRPCRNFGYCNPCDIKIKTDRFMQEGHVACDIELTP